MRSKRVDLEIKEGVNTCRWGPVNVYNGRL